MPKLSPFFYQKTTLSLAIVTTIITFAYLYLVMMKMAAGFSPADSPETLGTSFGFSIEKVAIFFADRTPSMLQEYRQFNLVWDNIFAFLNGLMYTFWLSYVYKPLAHKLKTFNMLPFSVTIFDWLENIKLVDLVNQSLDETPLSQTAVSMASYANMAKWVCLGIVFLLLAVGIIARIKQTAETIK